MFGRVPPDVEFQSPFFREDGLGSGCRSDIWPAGNVRHPQASGASLLDAAFSKIPHVSGPAD